MLSNEDKPSVSWPVHYLRKTAVGQGVPLREFSKAREQSPARDRKLLEHAAKGGE